MPIRKDDQRLEDISFLMELVEREENMLETMGLFGKDYLTGTLASFERKVHGTDDMVEVARGADRQIAGDDEAETAHVSVPFFTLDKVTKPHEIQDLRQFGTVDAPESVQNKVRGIVARIQRSHVRLHKKAMYAALKGATYGKSPKRFQAMFDIADADMFNGAADGAKAFDLTGAANPMDEFELFRKHIAKVAGDAGDNYEIVMLMGNEAFTALKNNVKIQDAFKNYTDGASLKQRLGGLKTGRVLELEGIAFIEDTSGEVESNKGYIFAKGLVDFQIRYAPADTEEHVNTVASEAYLFMDQGRRHTSVESEASLVCVNTRPDCVGIYTFTV